MTSLLSSGIYSCTNSSRPLGDIRLVRLEQFGWFAVVQRRVGRSDALDERRRAFSDAVDYPTPTAGRTIAVLLVVISRGTQRRRAVIRPRGMRTNRRRPQGEWWCET